MYFFDLHGGFSEVIVLNIHFKVFKILEQIIHVKFGLLVT